MCGLSRPLAHELDNEIKALERKLRHLRAHRSRMLENHEAMSKPLHEQEGVERGKGLAGLGVADKLYIFTRVAKDGARNDDIRRLAGELGQTRRTIRM